ncbi:aldo/keto reductase [Paracoccus sp. p3-h83]|uniref:aldo/keto reductase n=1 Tax=Paracoccus sp. p3-h83 TaxID=3342805 RepID=UPI0035B7C756
MKQVRLGSTGPMVSAVSLGTMIFGNQTGADDAFAQMDMALDAGITLFDVAEMYPVNPVKAETAGNSERIIGDWLTARGLRDRVQIATKVTGNGSSIRGGEGFDGAIIGRTIDASLGRLKTDVIDLYQLHWPMRGSYAFRQNWRFDPSKQDPAATHAHMEDVVATLEAARAAGKIRAWGLSNESAWGMTRWCDMAERAGAARPVAVQNEYSLLYRAYDTDLAEAAVHEGFTLLAYSPLAAGLLTGKYAGGVVPDGSRVAVDKATGGPGNLGGRVTDRAHAAVAAYADLARAHGTDLIGLSLGLTLSRPFPVIPILGATRADQLRTQIDRLDLRWTDEIDRALRQAHKAHPMPF